VGEERDRLLIIRISADMHRVEVQTTQQDALQIELMAWFIILLIIITSVHTYVTGWVGKSEIISRKSMD
jgi:hypothetical protein